MERKKLVIAAGAGVVVLLAAVLLVAPPMLLSSDWVRRLVLSRAGGSIPGELSARNCSVGWQKGPECTEVVYKDEARGLRLEVAGLSSSQGLWSLLTSPENLGVLVVRRPSLALTLPQPQESSPASSSGSGQAVKQTDAEKAEGQAAPGTSSASKAESAPSSSQEEFLKKINGKLQVSEAVVRIAAPGQPELVLGNGRLNADLAAGELKFDLSLESGEKGRAEAEGRLNAAGGSQANAEVRLTIADLPAGPLLALKPGPDGLPQGSGSLSADLILKSFEKDGIEVQGPVALTDVDVSGGMLGDDHPRFGRLAFDLNLRESGGKWTIPGLQLLSDFGSLTLQGGYAGAGSFQGSGDGKIDLAVLLAQFPHLFNVREDLRLDGGELKISAELTKEGGQLQAAADAAVSRLAGRQNGESFSWDSPLTASLVGSLSGKEPAVERLAFKAPFLDLAGQGSLQQFSLNGTADLGQAVQEIGRIIRFDWEAAGKMKMDLQLSKGADGRYSLSAKADVADGRLVRQGKELLPSHAASFSGTLEMPGKIPEADSEAAALSFELSSWAGNVSGTLDGIHRKAGGVSANCQLRSQLLLGRITELLHSVGAADPETSLAGTLDLEASGYAEESKIVLRGLDSRIKDFILYQQGKIFRDPDLHLFTFSQQDDSGGEKAVRPLVEAESSNAFFADGGGYSMLDAANRRLVLRNLGLSSGPAELKLRMLALDDWLHKPMPAIKTLQASGRSDLSRLADLLRQMGAMASEQKLGGEASFAVELAGQAGIAGSTGNAGTVEIDLDRFFFGKEGNLLAAKEKVEFRSKLHGDLAGGDVYFTTFDLQSYPLSMQSSGKLELTGKNPHLSLEGNSTPDLAAVVAVLNGMYPLDISMEGKQKEKFSLHYPLSEKKKIDLQFATKLHADVFSKSGISVSDLSVDTGMKNGIMSTAFKGTLNGGTVQLSPRIDYTRTPPLASLAEPEQVFDNVGLAETLVEGLLNGIHPILGSLARPAGIISIRAERFSMPVGGKGIQQADFKLVLDLSRVALEPANVLNGILDLAGLAEQSLLMKEKRIVCEGRNGRISCSPIKLTVEESEMTLSGSAGFDGSLDYVLEVPVTKNLVGRKGYELLKGATLKVPIKGTREKPVYNPEAMMQAASGLLRQAAGHAAKKTLRDQVEKVVPGIPGLLDGLLGR